MSNQPEPLDIVCDAPPYSIVKASRTIGVQSPEDVRWCEIGHLLDAANRPAEWEGATRIQRLLLLASQPMICRCGKQLPLLTWCAFVFAGGTECHYLLGQCEGCRTVYWHKDE